MPRKPDYDEPLFADLPEWADVKPVEQYEGVNPVAPIFYTPECESRIHGTWRD